MGLWCDLCYCGQDDVGFLEWDSSHVNALVLLLPAHQPCWQRIVFIGICLCICLSVRPSVCLSVCTKTAHQKLMYIGRNMCYDEPWKRLDFLPWHLTLTFDLELVPVSHFFIIFSCGISNGHTRVYVRQGRMVHAVVTCEIKVFWIILKLFHRFISYVTMSKTEMKLFQPLKEF